MSDVALYYLYEAAVAGSMRSAGDKIGVAVSSISRQIAQLELELGLPLIERGRRTIRLTEAGGLAIEHYQGQLAEREAFLARLADLRGIRSGSIDLAIGEGFLGAPFTAMLDEFQRRNPLIRCTINSASSTEIVRRVAADESHIGLAFALPSDPKIRLRSSAKQPLTVIVAPSHPLAAQKSASIVSLSDHALCLGPKEFRIRQILGVVEARQHIFLDPQMTTNSILVMRDAARSGRFATILPQIAVLTELREGSLVSISLTDEGLEDTEMGLISRTGRQLEGAPLRMLTALEARLRSWTRDPAHPDADEPGARTQP
jgi:DNA-binding transcriptional LysR family regulator